MPTPRSHGGMALVRLPSVVPGFYGLNTENRQAILTPEWATALENTVLDEAGRLAARKGLAATNSSAFDATVTSIGELVKKDGTVELLLVTNTKAYSSTDGVTWTDRTGAIAFNCTTADSTFQFINFKDKLLGLMKGEDYIEFQGGGNITQPAPASCPTGNCGLGAFGRMWIASQARDKLRYSGLLDETDWTSADSGNIDMTNVWPDTDTIEAIASFNGSLVVFGRNNIVIWSDGQGSAIGIDPINLYVVDIITGTGCVARDSVQNVDGDLWFLSDVGVQSLGRLIQEKSNPLNNLTANIQTDLQGYISSSLAADKRRIKSVYSPEEKFYIISLPTVNSISGNDDGATFVIDTRGKLQDGTARVVGRWSAPAVASPMVRRRNGDLYFGSYSYGAHISKYEDYYDLYTAAGSAQTYPLSYRSGWLDMTNEGYLVIPKRFNGIFASTLSATVTFSWAFDFDELEVSQSSVLTGGSAISLWGGASTFWGTSLWGAGIRLRQGKVQPTKNGEYIRLGLDIDINQNFFAIQQLELFAKIGRYA